MSWKSLVTAGLLCALASPAFAAPSVTVAKGGSVANGNLDANGNWVWLVRLYQSNPPVDLPDPDAGGPQPDPPAGSPLGAELGFTSDRPISAVSMNATDFDTPNPGNVIFGWEDLTNLGGTGACDSGTPGNCPVGLLWDGNDASAPDNQIFSAFGSVDYLSDIDGKDYMTITVAGPNTANLTSQIGMTGSYGAGNNMGRIAELNPAWDPSDNNPPISLNYDTYTGTYTRTVIPGDADMSGQVTVVDLNAVLGNWQASPRAWHQGNFNGQADNQVTVIDLNTVLGNWQASGGVGLSSGGGGVPTPEPATLALVSLAGLGLMGLRRRG